MPKGGAREGAGRKPKADEIKVIEQMDAVATPSEAWQALWAKCVEGDTQAIKTWLNYRFGMPVQRTETDGNYPYSYHRLNGLMNEATATIQTAMV
jgi:hypothetical protein